MTAIFQFWDRVPPPAEVTNLMESWSQCADYSSYRLWNDGDALLFLENNYDSTVVNAYRQCAVPAMKADFFRYCVLFTYGGLYVDADVKHLNGLANILAAAPRAVLFRRQVNIANDVLYFANAKDPLLAEVITRAIVNIGKKNSNNVWLTTGPGIMTMLEAEGTALFDGITWLTVKEMKKFVEFNWDLPYKASESHWVSFQNGKSIYES